MADLNVERAPRRTNALALAALGLGLLALLLLFLTGPGARFGWWHFRTSFSLMKYAQWAGIAAGVLGLVALLMSRGRGRILAGAALVMGALAWFVPWNWRRGAMSYPPIHDITTDTRTPPPFVSVLPLRADAPNPPEYLGDSIAAVQREAYPDLGPLMMAMPVDSAYVRALAAAREMGWEMVDQDRRDGRIEATATTPWFGFKDDVVIRVRSASGIARVDVRSKSRVGRGDVGANAKRIRAYLDRLRALDPQPIQTETPQKSS